MQKLKSALIVEYGYLRLLLFKKHNDVFTYFNEQKVDYDGFTENGFVSPDNVFYKIQELYSAVEKYGRVERTALVVLPGVFFKYGIVEKNAEIPSGTVSASDVTGLLDACDVPLPSYAPVQKRALFYKTLNNLSVADPIGEKTEILGLTASVEYLKLNMKELFDNCGKRLGMDFECTSFGAAVATNGKASVDTERVFVILADGNIDVVLTKGNVPIAVRSDLLGARHIGYSLAEELDCSDEKAEEIMLGSNLNLNFTDSDKYHIGLGRYSVATVNTCLAEAFIYIAGGVKKCLEELAVGVKILYLTGSDACTVRGVKELFEDETGCEAEVLCSSSHNLTKCGDYVAASVENYIRQKSVKNKIKTKLKALFGSM